MCEVASLSQGKGNSVSGGEAVLYVWLNGNGGEHTHTFPPVVHVHFVACSVAIDHGRPLLRRKSLPVAQREFHRPQCKA